jgi:hypothetical protein
MLIDESMAVEFLRTYHPDDWISIFVKSYASGRIGQRILPVELAITRRIQDWLRRENESGMNVYVSLNAVAPRQTSRNRAAIRAIRHVFVDADHDGAAILAGISQRRDLPRPSYVLYTSRQRLHVLWRVRRFTADSSEALQRHLAQTLETDGAATSCTQMTRIPGFVNHKSTIPYLVAITMHEAHRVYEPTDFPMPKMPRPLVRSASPRGRGDAVERARRYVATLPPAIAGQHGDVLTFQVCCRLARGFSLSNVEAMTVLNEWNARCVPPWTHRELLDKLKHARRYGREPIGRLAEKRHCVGMP